MGVFVSGGVSVQSWPRVTRTIVTPPTDTPITLESAKRGQRIDHDVEDEELNDYLLAAVRRVELDTGTALMTQTQDLGYDVVPAGRVLELPIAPIQEVVSIGYQDSENDAQVWDDENYYLHGNRIGLVDTSSWPTDLRGFVPLTVRVVAGHASADLVPIELKQAVRFVFGWLCENREPAPFELQVYEHWIRHHVRLLTA